MEIMNDIINLSDVMLDLQKHKIPLCRKSENIRNRSLENSIHRLHLRKIYEQLVYMQISSHRVEPEVDLMLFNIGFVSLRGLNFPKQVN